jgi:hypothetical protein
MNTVIIDRKNERFDEIAWALDIEKPITINTQVKIFHVNTRKLINTNGHILKVLHCVDIQNGFYDVVSKGKDKIVLQEVDPNNFGYNADMIEKLTRDLFNKNPIKEQFFSFTKNKKNLYIIYAEIIRLLDHNITMDFDLFECCFKKVEGKVIICKVTTNSTGIAIKFNNEDLQQCFILPMNNII